MSEIKNINQVSPEELQKLLDIFREPKDFRVARDQFSTRQMDFWYPTEQLYSQAEQTVKLPAGSVVRLVTKSNKWIKEQGISANKNPLFRELADDVVVSLDKERTEDLGRICISKPLQDDSVVEFPIGYLRNPNREEPRDIDDLIK